MPFGKKARSVRAYEFGCLPPTGGEGPAVDAMFARVRLWNRLVELDQERDAAVELLLKPHLATGADKAALKAARKAAWQLQEIKDAAGVLDRQLYAASREACHSTDLYWCNYEAVLVAFQTARRKPGDLRFHSARLEPGKVSVRWQTGLPVADAFGDDTRMRIDPVDPRAWSSPARSERRKLARTVLHLRVASENRKPIWLDLPMVMHRPLPEGGLVRECSVLRDRVGLTWRWKAVLIVETVSATLDSAAETPRRDHAGVAHSIALDLGWRKRPAGLRVCAWRDDAGQQGELILPSGWLSEMGKVEDLRSIRDQNLNAARASLLAWLGETPSAPEWLAEERKTSRQWKRAASMMRLWRVWRESRFDGDAPGLAMVEAWGKRDVHLYSYEANLRDQLLVNRREQYRHFAASLAKRYGRVVLEDFDLSGVADLERHGAELVAKARHMRFLAAPSALRQAVLNACGREGIVIEKVPSPYTTMICSECGSLEQFDKAAELVHECSGCGAVWDQDYGAAANLLDPEFSQRVAVLVQEGGLRNGCSEDGV